MGRFTNGFPEFTPVSIPVDIAELLGFSAACSCGRTHRTTLAHVVIQRQAIDAIVEISREVGQTLTLVVVADKTTSRIAGTRVRDRLGGAGHNASLFILPDGPAGRPHADEHNLALVESAIKNADLAVAVGSGTVNDLTKLASYRIGIPYITVATAPSMNGYTSAIAAVMMHGVKRTVACHQPMAVVADLDILRAAPLPLIAAGIGDLESKPTATADFRLGGMVRDSYYCPAPEQVVLLAEKRAAEQAAGLPNRDLDAVAALTEALILSGISMTLAGSSSPASGGEHLISHFWDMTAEAEARIEGWHGAQVGVATIVMASLYESLAAIEPDNIDVRRVIDARLPFERRVEQLSRTHGRLADEVIAEYGLKRLSDDALEAELTEVKENWDALWQNLFSVLRPVSDIRAILSAAGAPTDISALGLTPKHLDIAFRNARYIRGRFTVLDFAADLGLLDKMASQVLEQSGCLS